MSALTPHLLDYAVNTLWQLPLLAAATWILIRLTRPSTFIQHILWIATLASAVLLPLRQPAIPITPVERSIASSGPLYPSFGTPPLPPTHLLPRGIHLPASLIVRLTRLWLLVFAIHLTRFVLAWIAVRRLIARSRREDLLLDEHLLQTCANRLNIPVPEIRFLKEQSAVPAVAGILHPILFLPEHLAHDYELSAILLHEFGHIRRRDTLVNAVCRLIALPIAWHPVTPLLHARISRTREILCDTLAAEATGSPTAYARSLLTLSRDLQPDSQPCLSQGLFSAVSNSSALEERIMKLIAPASPKLSHRTIRITVGVAAILAATVTAAAFHLQPTSAAEEHQDNSIANLASGLVHIYSLAPNSTWRHTIQPFATIKWYTVGSSSSGDAASQQLSSVTPTPELPQMPVLPPLPAPPSVSPTPRALEALPAPAAAAVTPASELSPAPQTAPAPAPNPKPYHHSKVIIDGVQRDLTPAEQADLDEQLANVQAQVNAAMAASHFDQKQVEEQLKHLQSPEFHREMTDLQKQLNSAEFQKQIAEASRLASEHVINSNAMREQFAQASRELAKAQSEIVQQHFNIQIDQAQMQAQIKAATDTLVHIKVPEIHIDIDSMNRQLDEAQKVIDQTRKHIKDTPRQP